MAEKSPAKKSRFGLLTGVALAVIVVPVAAIGIFLATFDPNAYRGQIAEFLTEKLGRKVSLNGAMHLKIAGGPALEVNDIAIANPGWGSRPDMAKIGQMALAVKIAPLLASPRRLEVTTVTLNDADVQLETSAQGAKNWEFKQAEPVQQKPLKAEPAQPPTEIAPAEPGKMPLAISLDKLEVKNVRFAMVEGGKQKLELKLKELTLKAKDKTELAVSGVFNQQPFSVTMTAGMWQDLLEKKPWAFEAEAKYLGNDFTGKGTVLETGKAVELSSFKLVSSIGSTVTGTIKAALGGARPSISGAIAVDAVNLPEGEAKAEKTVSESAIGGDTVTTTAPVQSGRLFSDAKIDLSALKSADAKLAVTVGKVAKGKLSLDDIKTDVVLQNGNLRLPQITASLAGNPLRSNLEVNAAPPRVAFGLDGKDMNLQPLLQALGHNLALGKTTVAIDTTTTGDSVRALAGNLDGQMLFKLGTSTLPADALGPVVTNLIKLASPGMAGGPTRLACSTIRFKAQNGVMTGNGMIVDSSIATVAGEGNIDLRSEQLKLTFQPKAKDAKLAAISAPLHIGGTLAQPAFQMDSVGAIAGIASSFLGKDLPVNAVAQSGIKVPVVNETVADPCTEALDHPTYAADPAAPNSAAGTLLGKGQSFTQDKVKNLTDKAPPALKNLLGGDKSPLKGLFGK